MQGTRDNRIFPRGIEEGAAILRSPVNIDAVQSILGQGQVASVLSKIYVQMIDDSTLSHYSTCQLFYVDVHRFIC